MANELYYNTILINTIYKMEYILYVNSKTWNTCTTIIHCQF